MSLAAENRLLEHGGYKMAKKEHHSPLPLCAFRQYWTYQGYYKLTPAQGSGMSVEDVFNKSILYITGWLKGKLGSALEEEELNFFNIYPDAEEYASFRLFEDGKDIIDNRVHRRYDINVLAIKDESEWTLRMVEPQTPTLKSKNVDEPQHLERQFVTNAALKKADDCVYFTARVTCKEPEYNGDDYAAVFRPAFVHYIYDDESIVMTEGAVETGEYPIDGSIISMNTGSKEECRRFFDDLINNPFRQHSIVLFNPEMEEKDRTATEEIAKLLGGCGYIVTEEESKCFANLFNVMDMPEAISKIKDNYLVIYPLTGDSFDSAETEWFPVYFKDRNRMKDEVYSYTFRKDGVIKTPKYMYGDVLFCSDLKKKYVEEIGRAADKGLLARLAEQLKEAERDKASSSADEQKRKLEEIEKTMRELERQNGELRRKNAEYAGIIEQKNNEKNILSEKLKRACAERDNMLSSQPTEEMLKAREKNRELAEFAEEYMNKYLTVTLGPGKFIEVIPWIKSTFPETIFIHPDAERAYNKLGREYPVDKVCAGFVFLNAFVRYRRGDWTKEQYLKVSESELISAFFGESERTLSSNFDKTDAPEAAFIEYKGIKQLLNLHVTYSEVSSEAIRIYFIYDADEGKAVVGSMPDHLAQKNHIGKDKYSNRIHKI